MSYRVSVVEEAVLDAAPAQRSGEARRPGMSRRAGPGPTGGRRWRGRLLGAVYWLAVLAVAGTLVLGLLMFLESRDESSVGDSAASSRANTTMRFAAL